ncbi:MAG: hypothetical protein JXR22_14175 [Prolixibacteraceae bacterium]|nr:hypothetical protein [Prolixibacteraceae bacterium]
MKTSHILLSVMLMTFLIAGKKSSAQFPNVQADQQVNLYGILYYQPHGLDGSPYLSNEWRTGNVRLTNGEEASSVKMKLNILTNDLVYYNEYFKNLFLADKLTVASFVMKKDQPDSMLFIKYQGPELGYRLKKNDFVHLVHAGKITLLVKYSADVSEANDITSRDKIYPRNYYFVVYENRVTEVKIKLKSITKAFPEHKKEIKKLATSIHFRNNSLGKLKQLVTVFEETL